ncbi:MAG: phage major tail tube protein [Pseudomonadota bacterium]
MGLPAILKNFTLFLDGTNYIGQIGEVGLGKIAEKVESIRPGGLLGEIDVAMGLEKFEVEMKFAGLVEQVLRQFGAIGVAGTLLRFVGAYQEDVEGGVKPAELVVRGRIPEIDPGTAKPGDKTEWTVKLTGVYVKWTVSGIVQLEIDWLNCIYIVGGVDRYAEIRAALGMN